MLNSIAVVIPMYNASKTIERALNSLNSQTLLPERVVVIDDGSTDGSYELVKSYIQKVSFPLEIHKQDNSGPSLARNNGVELTSEEIICFFDSDDEWAATKLEKQIGLYKELTKKGRKVGIIDCFINNISDDIAYVHNEPVLSGYHFRDFIEENAIKGTSCVMLTREAYFDCGGFNPKLKYSEDRLLWSSVADKYEIHTLQEVLVNRYFGQEGNITSNPDKNYPYKLDFADLFVEAFKSRLSKKDIIRVRLSGIYDFLTVYYVNKNYERVVSCYKDMFRTSISSLWYKKGIPFAKFLNALRNIFFTRGVR